MDKLERKVFEYIENNKMINDKDTLIIGLSGGADSVCLFDLLIKYRKKKNIEIVAVHVNHQIRGEEADQDEEFVKKLCENNQVKCEIFCKNIPKLSRESGESEEECGRRIRYEAFNLALEKYHADKIVVAHHMNDQVETVLFRMARGSGVKGIGGMKNSQGNIIRPLLCVSKDEINEYINENNLEFVEDYTNNDILYSRNYIRKEIVPRLVEVNKDALSHISELATLAGQMSDYISLKAQEIIKRAYLGDENSSIYEKGIPYNVEKICSADEFLLPYIIRGIFETNRISLKDVTKDHINNIKKILLSQEAKIVELPRGIRVVKEGNILKIISAENIHNNNEKMKSCNIGPGIFELGDKSRLECRVLDSFSMESIPRNAYTKWFDYDKICNSLCIRNRLPGDFIVVNEAGDHKKLKEYFINEKIPKSQRDQIKVIANESKVIWVIGYRISEDVKVTGSTKKVLEIKYIM